MSTPNQPKASTVLAEYMEKFGKRLNEQESRLGDELFMWLQEKFTLAKQQERDRLRAEVEKLKLDDRPEITEWLFGKAETRAYNAAISAVLAILDKE